MENKRKEPDTQEEIPVGEMPDVFSSAPKPRPKTKKLKTNAALSLFDIYSNQFGSSSNKSGISSSIDLSEDSGEKEQSIEKPTIKPNVLSTIEIRSPSKSAPIKVITYTESAVDKTSTVGKLNSTPKNMRLPPISANSMIPPGGTFTGTFTTSPTEGFSTSGNTTAPNVIGGAPNVIGGAPNVIGGAPATIVPSNLTGFSTQINKTPLNKRIIDLTPNAINFTKANDNIRLAKEMVSLIKKISTDRTRAIANDIIDYMISMISVQNANSLYVIAISRRKYAEIPANDEQYITISPIAFQSVNVEFPPGIFATDMGFDVKYIFET